MRLGARVDRLERGRAAGAPPTCGDCGRLLHGRRAGCVPDGAEVAVQVVWGDADEAAHPDRCPTCGACLTLRIAFDRRG